jgi:hypothetical protein
MAECLSEAFGLNTDVALLFAEYFRTTALALSNEQCRTFIPDNDLADLLALSLDHLLEYEYGSPQLIKHIGDVLALYEKFQSDSGTVHGEIGRLWERKPSDFLLPLSISEIRQLFPFPLMNPIVAGHGPGEMREKWEGKGLPLWKWSTDGATCWFFASSRDYAQFLESDDFVSTGLTDGAAVLCLFPPDEVPQSDGGLALWCRKNGKLKIEPIPQLLADFLFSGTGVLTVSIPGDLPSYLETWKAGNDVLLSRKAQIYSEALMEFVRGALPQPKYFCKEAPPDADNVWGGSQVSDRTVAVPFLSTAWADLNTHQKAALAQLRELFRSGRDGGRGAGDLNRLMPRSGAVGMADDLLPRYDRTKMLTDSPVIQRIQSYWPEQDQEELITLAHQVSLEKFLKLHTDENRQRLLESLWRAVRGQFSFRDRSKALDECTRLLESEILPVVESAAKLETRAKNSLGATGIEFEAAENLIKAVGGFRQLLDMMKVCLATPTSTASQTQKAILELFGSNLDLSKMVRTLQSQCETARRELDRLDQTAEILLRNYWEYSKAVAFLDISEGDLQQVIDQEKNVQQTCTLGSLTQEAKDGADWLDQTNQALKRLEERLSDMSVYFGRPEQSETE